MNAQIQALVSGKTAYRRHARKDVSGYAFFDPGGSYLAFRSDKGASRGAWSISDDRFCYQLSGRDSECFEVHDEGNGTYRLYEQPGGPMKPKKHIWTWERIVDGNVENMR
ncbi:MAG: hypothetical protein H6959_05860 [Chromatiaceae bacterium]|nr:hypothetical protein [Chromatiaceae bacterium]MCP5422422.1 hypothetical protein [Chromatiaceae bacterium]